MNPCLKAAILTPMNGAMTMPQYIYIYIQEFMYHQTELNIAKMSWLTMNMAPLAIFQMAIDRPQTKWKKIQQKHRRMHGFSSYGVAEG